MSEYDFPFQLDKNVRRQLNFGTICQKFSKGAHCPECARATELYNKSTSATSKSEGEQYLNAAKSLFARSKIFLNGLIVNDEDKTFPVRIFAITAGTYDEIIKQANGLKYLNTDPNVHNIFHPITGRNVLISRTGSKLSTRYTVQLDQTQTKIQNEVLLAKLLKGDFTDLFDLDNILEHLANGYSNIIVPNKELNIFRFLPAIAGKSTVYREVKFHPFSAESFKNITPGTTSISSSGPLPVEDEFDPFALTTIDSTGKSKEPSIPVPVNLIEVTSAPAPSPVPNLSQVDLEAVLKELQKKMAPK